MEKELRKKLVIVCMSVVFAVLFIMAAIMNIVNYIQIEKEANQIVAYIIENDGQFPRNFVQSGVQISSTLSEEAPFTTRYFTIRVNEEEDTITANTNNVIAITSDMALEYATEVLDGEKISGTIGNYKFQKVETEEGYLIVFVDYSEDLYLFQSFLVTSIIICTIALVAVFILIVIFSKKAVSPIVKSHEKQKQFITDMSHEIKTPLAIIKANTEVMELESEENEWSKGIHQQVKKLSDLVTALLSLAKLNEKNEDVITCEFSLSDAVEETVEPLIVLTENQVINLEIQKNISFDGDEQSIRRLVSILLENAIKYSTSHSEIRVRLFRKKDKIHLQCINDVKEIQAGKYDKWFERFYREESSRNSSTGGFGIGLAMAKSIVSKHGGKISAESPDGQTIEFKVEFSEKRK